MLGLFEIMVFKLLALLSHLKPSTTHGFLSTWKSSSSIHLMKGFFFSYSPELLCAILLLYPFSKSLDPRGTMVYPWACKACWVSWGWKAMFIHTPCSHGIIWEAFCGRNLPGTFEVHLLVVSAPESTVSLNHHSRDMFWWSTNSRLIHTTPVFLPEFTEYWHKGGRQTFAPALSPSGLGILISQHLY